MWINKVPEWVQLVMAVAVLSGGMLATYVANEVSRENLFNSVSRHETKIIQLQSSIKDIPIIYERLNQLHFQNERQVVVFEKLVDSVDRLSVNVARLDERMRAIESK